MVYLRWRECDMECLVIYCVRVPYVIVALGKLVKVISSAVDKKVHIILVTVQSEKRLIDGYRVFGSSVVRSRCLVEAEQYALLMV